MNNYLRKEISYLLLKDKEKKKVLESETRRSTSIITNYIETHAITEWLGLEGI